MNEVERLMLAAEQGDTATVLQLIEGGLDVNMQDARGRTAVLAATQASQAATVAALLEVGADVNIRDARLDNVLLYAGAEGLLEVLKLAIAAGADTKLTNRYGGTALIPACERGHVEVVRELLTQTDVNVNHVNNLGWTGLLEAIVLSDGDVVHQRVVELLIRHGADVNLPDKDGIRPLQHARSRGFKEIAAMLEKAGAQ